MPEGFNYSLRYAKNIERKLICDTLARLGPFDALADYRYVGFGSIWFVDFRLFHTRLGISSMISIEDTIPKDRCAWNAPYACVEVIHQNTSNALPKLPQDLRSATWLDYTCGMRPSVIDDLGVLVSSVRSGSCILVTLNAKPGQVAESPMERMSGLASLVEKDFIPAGVTNHAMSSALKLTSVYRDVLHAAASEHARRKSIEAGVRREVQQVLLLHYKDGAPMMTWGAVVIDEPDIGRLAQCSFGTLEHTREGTDPFVIAPPLLTEREMRELERLFPDAEPAAVATVPVTPEDAGAFRELYRFYPTFAETFGA